MIFPLGLLLAGLSSHATAQSDISAIGRDATTSSGTIKGHASHWQPKVSEYLGIPYAQPPVGHLRWLAPKPFRGSGAFVAANYSASCPANIVRSSNTTINYDSFRQTLLGTVGQIGDVWDEDCLTLNVWTKRQAGEKPKAVLVWIYGGGFGSGNTNTPVYNGARLANDEDVVIVTLNYRLNIFGFPRATFLPDLNLGLLDQRLAVEWVRDNIAAFGGDPKRITLFGQSAGGVSVDYYTYAWTKDPIATGFIPESGSASPIIARSTNASAAWYITSQHLGCGGVEKGADTLACMRGKKWEDLYNAMEKRGVTPPANGFMPTVDNKVVFGDLAKRRREGNFIKAVSTRQIGRTSP
jgi:carboxylesterase type B